jgi:thiol-disulfide isomerase/thioredoxin
MKVVISFVLLMVISACSTSNLTKDLPATISLPDLGSAPDFDSNIWINVDAPLHIADLKGKVVLMDMWTFGCSNCQHVIPSLREWYKKYKDQGFVVVGNHFPEFARERELNNLKEAIVQWEITYPVVQDNDGKIWSAYNNRYWPTLYLIDKNGHLRYTHIGEGSYQETEAAIQSLLAEN